MSNTKCWLNDKKKWCCTFSNSEIWHHFPYLKPMLTPIIFSPSRVGQEIALVNCGLYLSENLWNHGWCTAIGYSKTIACRRKKILSGSSTEVDPNCVTILYQNRTFARWHHYYYQNPFLFFLSYLNLVIPARFKQKSPDLHKKEKPWRILVVVVAKWHHRANGLLRTQISAIVNVNYIRKQKYHIQVWPVWDL